MAVMYLVWPLTALFGSILWLWLYWRHGRGKLKAQNGGRGQEDPPMPIAVAKGTSHCGAGCTLGDIIAE
jgi:hypothetical protein